MVPPPRKIVSAILLILSAVPLLSGEDLAVERNSLGMELRLCEGGRYLRGTDGGERALQRAFPLHVNAQYFGNPESPAHVTWVTRPFWIAGTEVTVGQWRQFVEETGYVTTVEKGDAEMVGWAPTPEGNPLYQSHDFSRKPEFSWRNPGFGQQEDHPVVGVSWTDAQAFLRWLSRKENATYRLPTEAEWEFACRAGTGTWFSFGDEPRGAVHRHGNIANVELEKHRKHATERQWLLDWEKNPGDGHVFTAPVGSYEGNPFGLHDMHGNVWEWCQDLWLDTFYKRYDWPKRGEPRLTAVDPVNESEPQTTTNRFRSIRGGSWCNGPVICRSANRVGWDEADAAAYIGFRVVKEADPDKAAVVRESLAKEESAKRAAGEAGGIFHSADGIRQELRFESDEFPSAVLPLLQALPELEKLVLGTGKSHALTPTEIEAIAGLGQLRSIDFRGAFDLTEVSLSPLQNLPRLEELRFSRSTSLNDAKLRELGGLTTLTEFQCYGAGGGLSDDGIAALAANRDLVELHLTEVDAGGVFLRKFRGIPLEKLSLTARSGAEVRLTDEQAKELTGFSGLLHLALNQQGLLTDATLLGIGTLEELTDLNLQGCSGFTTDGFAPIGNLRKLRSLNLQGTAAGDRAVAALSGIPRIQILRLGSPALTDEGLEALGKVFSLQNLYIETCLGSDGGIQHLGRINRLRQLDLGSPLMTGKGLGPVAGLPELNDLRLRSPALTDEVFEIMARAKSLRKLRLVERGWQPPSALTDEGIRKIASATWLTELWLPRNHTGITVAGIEKLDTLMPKTSVIAYTVEWDKPEEAE